MLKYGVGVLPNTPTKDFENVLFWTFKTLWALLYAMDFDKNGNLTSDGLDLHWVAAVSYTHLTLPTKA